MSSIHRSRSSGRTTIFFAGVLGAVAAACPVHATDSCGTNFTCETAVDVDFNSCYAGNPLLVSDNIDDWFIVGLAYGQRITILLTFPHATADVDTAMYEGCRGALATYSNGVSDSEFMDYSSFLPFISPLPWRVYLYSGTSNFYLMQLWKSNALVPNDLCFFPLIAADGDQDYSTIGATTHDAVDFLCLYFGSDTIDRDIWYRYTASCSGTLSVGLCGSTYDTRLAIYDAAVCPNVQNQALACNDDFCVTSSYLEIPASPGTEYLIRIGGYAGDSGSGTMTITCTPDCPADMAPEASGDGVVGIADLLTVIGAWGPCGGPCTPPSTVAQCPADVNNDCIVGIADLLAVIGAWGGC